MVMVPTKCHELMGDIYEIWRWGMGVGVMLLLVEEVERVKGGIGGKRR